MQNKKYLVHEVKSVSDEGSIEGYLSVFGNIDSHGDIIVKGAFTRTLQNRGTRPVRFLRDHDETKVIGIFKELAEDDYGLKFVAQINMDTQLGRETYALLKQGAINELSIGYAATKEEFNPKTGIRYLTEIKLYEGSVVTWASNEQAVITSVKCMESAFSDLTEEQRIKTLQFIATLKAADINNKEQEQPLQKEEDPAPDSDSTANATPEEHHSAHSESPEPGLPAVADPPPVLSDEAKHSLQQLIKSLRGS